ncbi:MAG: hypothetical protein V3G42_10860 [Oscillospiraceae bacterium]
MPSEKEMTALHLLAQVQSSQILTTLLLYQKMRDISTPMTKKFLKLRCSMSVKALRTICR